MPLFDGMPDIKLSSPLQYLKGVGPRKAEVFAENGIETVRDLLRYYPRRYLDRTTVVPINRLQVGHSATIIGRVVAHGILRGRRTRYEAILQDDTAAISLLFFGGVRFWSKSFKKGQVYAATGTVTFFQGFQIVHPDLERLDDESDKMVHAGRIIPVYPQTAELVKAGLNSKSIRRLTTLISENLRERIPDPLPERERKKHGLIGAHEAVMTTHYPETREAVEQARRRLAFDELLELQYLVYQNKARKEITVKSEVCKPPGKTMKAFGKSLPFTLTAGQRKVIKEIVADMQKPHPMSRLMQGDVGCGKTVVAIAAAVYAAENGMQTAFMAPTEILVEQHFRNWQGQIAALGFTADLITSSVPAAERRKRAERAKAGETDILFGTHALIYDYVGFEKLGLVIIDEQHRFGVRQRGQLYAKGDNPDLLVMTATPIPRTLALTLYGDLDISTIDGLPPGRQPIRTAWRPASSLTKVYRFVKDEVQAGGQVYIVYPLIEKSDQMDLKNVEDAYEELRNGALAGCRLALVHGRIKPKERDQILADFRDGKIDVLLATTVIEVGLDNPNATVLIIEQAERFGLAQLHQLRGRVGRGKKQSTVVAIAREPVSDIAAQRLEYFAENLDGFKIAEADLELRGPGEIFGVKQSGLPELQIASLADDRDLLEIARALITSLHERQNDLDSEYRGLYSFLQAAASRHELNVTGG